MIKTAERRELIATFSDFYAELDDRDLASLKQIYIDDVTFKDPVQLVQGRDQLRDYLAHGLENALTCKFAIEKTMVDREQAFLVWQMRLQHEKLAGGREIQIPGTSHLLFAEDENRIKEHVDYYDLGAMIYEHIPLLGWVVGKVRNKLAGV
ncbi:nuclear transport factor 2 family protein [Aliidiomarina haloalkalitolerans]|uniref:Nuclear transport factor 2 family protein n=1 Tax=Aliidiomarina haloalkalitolerans TaxID=859059 RepID=A0A432VYL5_9GAMM|nr:nuclear transport factor 2 family protein [Aliidiomarina haloalkalitolerans]RUO21754.1 nuclear transport factor 2 family protein [Aliidiomarina haloalkalitolerans]